MGWIKKAIGSPSQARKVLADSKQDTRRPKDEVAQKRQQKNGGGRSK